jgi:two-component system, OmpR family, sensor histidine kinase BaeS
VSLKLKISLLFSGVMMAVVGGLSAVLILSEKRALSDGLGRQQAELAGGLADVCRSAAGAGQTLPLANQLRRLKESPEVVEAACFDAEGHVLGHTDVSLSQTVLTEPEALKSLERTAPHRGPLMRDGKALVEVTTPVTVGNRTLGAVRILFSKSAIDDHLSRDMATAKRRILGLALPATMAGFLASFLLTAFVVRPVDQLVQGVRAFAAGKLDHQISIKTKDEIGLLSHEFNVMADRLKEVDRLKQDFVSSVTHDLKSPLSAITVTLDLIEKESPRGPVSEHVKESRASAQKLSHLIFSMLDVAHIEAGLTLEKKPVNLEELADRVVRSLKPIARQKGVALDFLVEAALPPVPVDELKMERALTNLAGNALKFTDTGSVVVALSADGKDAVLRVEDTGPGIPAEALARLFTKFYRVPAGGLARKEGTGLGLVIVKGLVEAHGGSVSVKSTVGEGTVFTVRIPLEETT